MIGTDYIAYHGNPDDFVVTEAEIQNFIDEINRAYPAAKLERADVSFVQGGLVPITGVDPETGSVQLTKHFKIDTHQQEGLHGLISVTSVKYTTARYVAEKVVDTIYAGRGQKPPRSRSAVTPIYGGQIEDVAAFVQTAIRAKPHGLDADNIRQLVYNYGSAYPEVLRYLDQTTPMPPELPANLRRLKAETLHGVYAEMAHKLADIVFRRTELGTAGHPGNRALQFCASVMGEALGWSPARTQQELDEVVTRATWTAKDEEYHGATLANTPVQQVSPEAAQV
jgi:glycerol-3-phosphate dehydrogenase